MVKEIGGYFELSGFYNSVYHDNAIALNTARNCLIYIIRSKKIKKIYIPYYLCDSVNKASSYCEIEYYAISNNFLPAFEKKLEKNEYIYIVNYFGILSNSTIIQLREKYKNIIIDNVQAFFQKPVKDIDTIYSCRKFFGVPDGAYLYTNNILKEELDEDYSKDRFKHIFGRTEKNAEDYYSDYRDNEQLLEKLPIRKMSKSTRLILSGIDYEKVKQIRTENFKYLNNELKQINNLKLENIEGAYTYPLYLDDARHIREILIKNKIYVPILWPNVIEENKDTLAYNYAVNILPLPCDQRYGYSEMQKIVDIVNKEK